jgi:NSS family neurotransmitter:Na+ symporter
MASSSQDRGQWTSRLGFILAAAGSAIGLGNIWRFPYMAGEGGGSAFVLLYLGCVLVIGIPVMLAELSIGRTTHLNPVGAFKALVPKTWWPMVGGLGVITGFGILAFYSVVAGWTLGYLYLAITGGLAAATDGAASGAMFGALVASPGAAILLTGIFLLLTVLIVRGGVSSGIERASKIMMPLLLVVLILLAIRSLSLPGGREGFAYLFAPDFSKMTFRVAMSAMGQALFSLSLGMGAMITYGSYFPEKTNLWQSGVIVSLSDTFIAILAGLVIFPALFSANLDPQGGPGLVFVTLPTIFNTMPAGTLFGIAFYLLLAIAALTSTISLLEVVVAYFVDERNWSREKASWLLGGFCFVLAIPSALSQGAVSWLGSGGLFGWDFLTLNNNIWGNYSLSIGAILICLFVGWKWGVPKALVAIEQGGFSLPAPALWAFLVRYFCPLAILAVLIFIIVTNQYF